MLHRHLFLFLLNLHAFSIFVLAWSYLSAPLRKILTPTSGACEAHAQPSEQRTNWGKSNPACNLTQQTDGGPCQQ